MRIRNGVAAAWLVAGMLAAFAGYAALAQQASPRPRAAPTHEVTYALASALTGTPVYVGVENGYWLKHGLDVKLKILNSGREIVEAIQTGDAQFGGVAFGTTLTFARAGGVAMKGVVPYVNAAEYIAFAGGRGIVGRKDRGILPHDPRSLVGKKIATLPGSTSDVLIRQYLRRAGIDLARVELLNVPVVNMPITLAQGLVDAAVPWEPYIAQILRELGDNAVVVELAPAGLLSDVVGVTAKEAFLAGNREIVKAFALGVAEAARFARQKPAESAKIVSFYVDGINQEDATAGIKTMRWDPRLSICTEAGIVQNGNDMIRQGAIKMPRPFTADDLRDASLIDEVVAEHPELFDDLPPLPRELSGCKGAMG